MTLLFILSACTEQVKQAESINRLPHIYPDYIGVTIPAEIAPLNFQVLEPSIEKVDVHITGTTIPTKGYWFVGADMPT